MAADRLPHRKQPAARLLLLVVLALAHLGLGFWLDRHHAAASRVARREPIQLRLDLPAPRPRAAPPPAANIEAPRLPLPLVVPIELPRFEIAPAFSPPTQPPSPDAANAAAQARPAPLNLALPSAPSLPASAPLPYKNPALSDPRANTRRADIGTRMADTLGTDQSLREESLGPGRHRFKQGSTCVETAESRIGQIDPMGATMRGSPQLVTNCK